MLKEARAVSRAATLENRRGGGDKLIWPIFPGRECKR